MTNILPFRKPVGDSEREDLESRFNRFLEDFRRLIRKAIRAQCYGLSTAEQEDVEQEIHLKIWEILKREGQIQHIASYIYRVAVTTTIDTLRRNRSRKEEPFQLVTEDERHAATTPDSDLQNLIETSISKLQPKRQIAVRLHLQGYNSDEIAAFFNWTEAKARNLIYRGMNDLRAELRLQGVNNEAE